MARLLVLITLPLMILAMVPPALALPDGAGQGTAAGTTLLDEVTIMHNLRRSLTSMDAAWVTSLGPGWQPDNPTHPCKWLHVICGSHGHVTLIRLWPTSSPNPTIPQTHIPLPAEQAAAGGGSNKSGGPLLPELAQLQWLEELVVRFSEQWPLHGGIPAEWGRPGAFQRLKRLSLQGMAMPAAAVAAGAAPLPLPDIQPGALPALDELHIGGSGVGGDLPASWGASPGVLPTLRMLTLRLQLLGPLPVEWARGFQGLTVLTIGYEGTPSGGSSSDSSSGSGDMSPPQAPPAAQPPPPPQAQRWTLPPEWASGFLKLHSLSLGGLQQLSGPMPDSWQQGGFPVLVDMNLISVGLSGTLPDQLLRNHPLLERISLSGNKLVGTLPEAWADPKVTYIELDHNSLSGAAFPPAWTQPGGMEGLSGYSLSGNAGLHGTLPAELAWSNLHTLSLSNTGLEGSIPAAWCKAPFASKLASLWCRGTAISPVLPACAARDMPNLRVDVSGGATLPPQAPSQQAGTQQLVLIVSLALLLPLAAVGAAAAAACLVWRRRRQRLQDRNRHDLQSLLQTQRSSSGGIDGGEAQGQAQGQGPVEIELADQGQRPAAARPAARGKRAQLAALVSIASQGSSQNGGGLEALPRQALPAKLMHQLGRGGQRQRPGGSSRAGGRPPAAPPVSLASGTTGEPSGSHKSSSSGGGSAGGLLALFSRSSREAAGAGAGSGSGSGSGLGSAESS